MDDLVKRLRGEYRIPITVGLGPAGGEEPDNATEFVRRLPVPPIQQEAAARIEKLETATGGRVPQLEPWRDELLEIVGHLGAAIGQSSANDDQIIMDHVRAAHEIAKIIRRKA